ncbi:hypothetical protein LCGC14_2223910 [marine sediment metagenome]|uniref:Uncharacterized protein n=1 Tax=marine sediment metagenome TaxID=412755 RepID=A0A0F9FMR1_9ZZZZ
MAIVRIDVDACGSGWQACVTAKAHKESQWVIREDTLPGLAVAVMYAVVAAVRGLPSDCEEVE